jgi:hypothetical protein
VICPRCKHEYRAGFTRCATCQVDLVDEDSLAEPEPVHRESHSSIDASTMAELLPFCGFLSLEEARHARDQLRQSGIPADILIRESETEQEVLEEYWIRVPRRRFSEVTDVLHEDPAEPEEKEGNGEVHESETFACSACGEDVEGDADLCPHCGARFDA